MAKETWIPFAEAILRMRKLYILDSEAKSLLRAAVAAKRVSGREEFREKGRFIFSVNNKGLDSDPNVIRAPGGFYYEAETYPAEVRLDEFSAWIDELAAFDRHSFSTSFAQISNTKPVSRQPMAGEVASAPERTGAPGRPTGIQLVQLEFRRRLAVGISSTSNGEEASELREWYLKFHPTSPNLTAKSIKNKLSGWRRAVAQK